MKSTPLRSQGMRPPSYLLGIVLLAFLLRALPLARQALWGDEGISIFLASHSPRYIIDNVGRVHPPGYFILLHWFSELAGFSTVAVRIPSVLFGVLSVPLIYQVARHLFGRSVGLVAGFLLVLSPFHIARSQDARMYPLVIFLSLLSLYLMLRLLATYNAPPDSKQPLAIRPKSRLLLWSGYVLVNAVALFVHYYVALFIIAQTIFVLLWRKGNTRFLVQWLAAQASITILFTPWLIYFGSNVWRGVNEKVAIEQAASLGYLSYWQDYLRVAGAGYVLSGWVEALILAVLGLGVVAWQLHRRVRGHLTTIGLCLVLLVAPVTMGFLVNLRWPVADFQRLLSPTTAPLYILVALGLVGIARFCAGASASIIWAGVIPSVVLLAGGASNLVGYYQLTVDRHPGAPDDRPLVEELNLRLQTQDAVLIETRSLVGNLLAYTPSRLPLIYYVPDALPSPSHEEQREQALRSIWQARSDIREAYLNNNGWAQERWLEAMEDWWSKTPEAKDVEGNLVGLATWSYGYIPDGYQTILDELLEEHGRLWFPYFQWPGNLTGMAIESYLTSRYSKPYDQSFGMHSLQLFTLPAYKGFSETASDGVPNLSSLTGILEHE